MNSYFLEENYKANTFNGKVFFVSKTRLMGIDQNFKLLSFNNI